MGVFSYSKNYLQLTCSLSTFSLRQELIHVLMDTHSVLACAQGLRRKSSEADPALTEHMSSKEGSRASRLWKHRIWAPRGFDFVEGRG